MYIHTTALVLNSEPWLEYDRLVTLYTEALGKVRVIAKGARRTLSKINPHLRVGNQVQVVVARGKEWWRITAAVGLTVPDVSSYEAWTQLLAWYRFWGKVWPEELVEEEIWQTCSWFQGAWVSASEAERQILYLATTLRLLYHVGYAPRWRRCGHCQAEIKAAPKLFYSWQGGVVCSNCPHLQGVNVSLGVAKVCGYFIEQPVTVWWGKKLDPVLAQELTDFLDSFLQFHFSEVYEHSFFSRP